MGLIGSPDVDFCLLEGRPLHNITTSMKHKFAQMLEQTDGAGATDEAHRPVGAYNFEASIEGFYNLGAGLAQEGLELEDEQVLMYALAGNAIGDKFTGIDGVRVDLETIAARAALHRIRANFKASAGPTSLGKGLVQTPYSTITGDVGPTNLGALDWGPHGRKMTPASGTGTTYTDTTVVDGVAWDLSAGAVGMLAVASSGKTGIVTNVNDGTDTVTVADWLPSNPANGETCQLHAGDYIDQQTGLAIGFLGVSALTLDGATGFTVIIQDGATVGGGYADRISFTVVGAAAAGEMVTVVIGAPAADIQEFTQLRYEFTGGAPGGATSVTFAAGLVRFVP